MDVLGIFYENVTQREVVKAFLLEVVTQYGVEKMYKREGVEGVVEAKEIIEKAFSMLAEQYKELEQPLTKDQHR